MSCSIRETENGKGVYLRICFQFIDLRRSCPTHAYTGFTQKLIIPKIFWGKSDILHLMTHRSAGFSTGRVSRVLQAFQAPAGWSLHTEEKCECSGELKYITPISLFRPSISVDLAPRTLCKRCPASSESVKFRTRVRVSRTHSRNINSRVTKNPRANETYL